MNNKTELNKEKLNEFRQLDPIKIAMMGLDMFLKDYGVRKETTYSKRLERLRLLSKDITISESDKKDMIKILNTLGKISNCDLCYKEINWDKKEEVLYKINPTETARHKSCHEKAEKV